MARPGGQETRARIRAAVREVIARDGIDGLTLDAVAERVGVTRQAVLYHFDSRDRLLAETVLELLVDESDALTTAAEEAAPGTDGVGDFLGAALDWYLADPNRFRLLYAVPQLTPLSITLDEETLEERVYGVTRRLYDALQERLATAHPDDAVRARRLGVALHTFIIGAACYQGMLEATDDNLVHDWHDIADTLAGALAGEPS